MTFSKTVWMIVSFMIGLIGLRAVTITGYDAAVHDRFTGGFPLEPVPNVGGGFIGLGYDWSGVGWSTTTHASSSYKGFGLLSPVHFLAAQHYEHAPDLTQGVRVLTQEGVVASATPASISNLGQGVVLTAHSITAHDLAIGTLASPVAAPTTVARYAVLDLHAASGGNTLGNYSNLDLLLYGRSNTTNGSPRIGTTPVSQIAAVGSDPTQLVIVTTRNDVQLLGGDSGSPAFHGWTNPNGDKVLTVVGVNSAIDATNGFNYISFLGSTAAMAAANTVMVPVGFALRVDGNVSNTWVGSSSTSIGNRGAWGLNPRANAPSDKYVLFDAATAGNGRAVTVDSNVNLRGLYFKATVAEGDGFTFSGASTLTLGRGGITNYDEARQVINAALTLGDHQYWDVGSGGVTATAINTNGRLLEIAGEGTAIITGAVSGGGGLALTGQRLELSGTSTYTGGTWVHDGRLAVSGNIASSSGVVLAAAGELAGTGTVGVISGAGSVHPGASPGILTAEAVDPTDGLGFFFEFTQLGSPNYGDATASGNDVLRLTGGAPFLAPLSEANTLAIFLNVPGGLGLNDVLRGGFFLDLAVDFSASIGGTFAYYLADPAGTLTYDGTLYSLYEGGLSFLVQAVAETAVFASGTQDGFVMELTVIPEPSMVAMGVVAGMAAWWGRRRRLSSKALL